MQTFNTVITKKNINLTCGITSFDISDIVQLTYDKVLIFMRNWTYVVSDETSGEELMLSIYNKTFSTATHLIRSHYYELSLINNLNPLSNEQQLDLNESQQKKYKIWIKK